MTLDFGLWTLDLGLWTNPNSGREPKLHHFSRFQSAVPFVFKGFCGTGTHLGLLPATYFKIHHSKQSDADRSQGHQLSTPIHQLFPITTFRLPTAPFSLR